MKECNSCHFYLVDGNTQICCKTLSSNPMLSVEKLKNGLIGECDDYKEAKNEK